MPIYEYRRPDGTTFDVLQKFTDDALTHDPDTGVPVQKVLSAPAIHFKGAGFHNTDYGTKKRPVGGGSEGSSSEGSGSSDASSPSSDSGSSSGDAASSSASTSSGDSSSGASSTASSASSAASSSSGASSSSSD
jgi:putative FmdB family regulatory protein